MTDFSMAVKYVLENEGSEYSPPSKSDLPSKFGITQITLSQWLGRQASLGEIENLSQDEAIQVYEKFWQKLKLDELAFQGSATAIFDCCVNCGFVGGYRLAQQASAIPTQYCDGLPGPLSISKINALTGSQFIVQLLKEWQDHYVDIVDAIPRKSMFLRGWLARSRRSLELINLNV